MRPFTRKLPRQRSDTFSRIKGTIELFLLIGGFVFGFYKFVYEDYIIPAAYPPYVSFDNDIEIVNDNDSICFVKVTIKMENKSKRRVFIPHFSYRITGIPFVHSERLMDSDFDIDCKGRKLMEVPDYSGVYGSELVPFRGKILYAEVISSASVCWIDVGQSVTRIYIYPINKKYNKVNLHACVIYGQEEMPVNLKVHKLINPEYYILPYVSGKEINLDSLYKSNKYGDNIMAKYSLNYMETIDEAFVNNRVAAFQTDY